MQKIFRKYLTIIVTASILFILALNFVFQMRAMKTQQYDTFVDKIDQIIHTMEENEIELDGIEASLNEDYITRAKAAAYVFERTGDMINYAEELQNLAGLLDVDEVHIIDENGILVYSSVPKYVGMDFHDYEQTREFLTILDGDENSYVIQETQPNAAEGKTMKYVGVARKEQKGIIQIGMEPTRLMEAQGRNTYEYIFSIFPTDEGEDFFAVSCETGEVIGHSNGVPEALEEVHQPERLSNCENGSFKQMENGEIKYIVTRQNEDVLIGAAIPANIMYSRIWKNMAIIFIYLLILEVVIIILLNYLVKKKVVNGIHSILNDLSEIADGNMDTIVAAGGNPELEELSNGINIMVRSIAKNSDRIAKIIDMSGMPLGAFEYQKGIERVFVTSNIRDLLELDDNEMKKLCRNAEAFYEKISNIMQQPIYGEREVYQIGEKKYIRILLSNETEGYLGIITDVTEEIIEKKRIQYDNNHDSLTGLSRYPYFKQRASQILLNMKPGDLCACVMMDLDSFKGINDTFGHDMGDLYLQSFAAILRKLPKEHCVVARRSGDEFSMIVFGYENRAEIIEVLDDLWIMLSKARVKLSPQHTRSISVSGGIAWTDDENTDFGILMNNADEALYKAKRGGKGHYESYIPGGGIE